MSVLRITKREFVRLNQITKMFTGDDIKILEKHDDDNDNYSSSNFPWGSSDALKLFLISKGDPYIEAQKINAKKRREDYVQRTFDKVLIELKAIATSSDLKNWGNTFAKDHVSDLPEKRKELTNAYTERLKELEINND